MNNQSLPSSIDVIPFNVNDFSVISGLRCVSNKSVVTVIVFFISESHTEIDKKLFILTNE